MDPMFIATAPVLLSVTALLPLCVPAGIVPNVRLPGVTLAIGTAPVPVRAIVCELPGCASLLIVRPPLRVPAAFGVKTTFTTQLAPGATLDPQLFDCEKSPDTEMELMFNTILPLLLIVRVEGALAVPILVAAKVRLEGDTTAPEAPPVPLRDATCVLVVPFESSTTLMLLPT